MYVIKYVTKHGAIRSYNVASAKINGRSVLRSSGYSADGYNDKVALRDLAEKIALGESITVVETHYFITR